MTDINNDKAASTALEPVAGKRENFPDYQQDIQYSQLMAKMSLMPAHLRGNPGNCLAVYAIAQTWRMNPVLVGLATSMIPKKGGGETLMFEGKLVNAAISSSPYIQGRLKFALSGDAQATVCVASGRLKGESEDRTVTVHMPKTQNSPLWSGNQGDKEQQLTYLAARVWCRRHLPEILMGVYTPEDDWTDREPDSVVERRGVVQSRVAALDAQPKAADTGKDDFIDGAVIDVGHGQPDDTQAVLNGAPVKKAGVVTLTVDPLDEPIPTFTEGKACESCGGRGILENADGDKEPCPDCSTSN